MFEAFESAEIGHVSSSRRAGTASITVISNLDFSTAAAEIENWNGYAPTPLHHLTNLARTLGIRDILYKDEGPRFGLGSFKALGGAYAAMRVLQREISAHSGRSVELSEIREGKLAKEAAEITLVSATDGNHGRSLAWGAKSFGARCRIYIHRAVSDGRAQSIRDYGAEVIRVDGDYDESVGVARQEAEQNGWFVVSDTSWEGYTQPPIDVMAGYGVMVDEIAVQAAQMPTHLFVQGGVGGLAAALTARLRQKMARDIRVAVVEPELAACLYASGETGVATTVAIGEETVMAGLSCGEPSELAWQVLGEEVSDFLTIPDSLVGPTMRLAANPVASDPPIVAGESAICGLAGLIASVRQSELRDKLGLDENSRVLVIGSEGATDLEIYDRILAEA